MRDIPFPWLTKWDLEMVKILSEIASFEDPPKLQMLFFANTFPLAYHYAIALIMADKPFKNRIVSGVWGAPEEDNLIRYTNRDKNRNRSFVLVTIFKPQYAFTPLTLASTRIRDDVLRDKRDMGITDRTSPLSISEFVEKAKGKHKFEDVIIYAELTELGGYLNNIIKDKFPKPIIFAAQGLPVEISFPVLELTKPVPSMLRVFIYGGSLSSYLLRKKDRYLPLKIDNSNKIVNQQMRTYVSCPPSCIKPIEQYHEALFKAAEDAKSYKENCSKCPQFFTVYRSYNEMAWLLQHRSSFKDAQEFACCLWEHHTKPIN